LRTHRLTIAVGRLGAAERHVYVRDFARPESRPQEIGTHGTRLSIDGLLDRRELGALMRKANAPGGQISGDIAFGYAADGDGPLLRQLVAAKPVSERVAARRQTQSKYPDRAQKDHAAVLQLLDHGSVPCVRRIADDHRSQSPVTIVDEPCIYSDELSETK
jgi:hypothetical protein